MMRTVTLKPGVLAAMLLVAASVAAGEALAYPTSGSLFYDAGGSGLHATDGWANSGTNLSWDISESGGLFTYAYTFTVPRKDPSHVILQVSGNFTTDNIKPGTTGSPVPGFYSGTTQGNSNPGMPGGFQGLKWNVSTGTTASWTLVTDRMPMMGNFYSKDGTDSGTKVFAYSGGAASFNNLVPVPDSTVVPLPGAAFLLGSGLAGMGMLRRRRDEGRGNSFNLRIPFIRP